MSTAGCVKLRNTGSVSLSCCAGVPERGHTRRRGAAAAGDPAPQGGTAHVPGGSRRWYIIAPAHSMSALACVPMSMSAQILLCMPSWTTAITAVS